MNALAVDRTNPDVDPDPSTPTLPRFAFPAPMDVALAALATTLEAAGFDVIGVESEFDPEGGGDGGSTPCVILVVGDAQTLAPAEHRHSRRIVLCALAYQSHGDTIIAPFATAGPTTRSSAGRRVPQSVAGEGQTLARCLDAFTTVARRMGGGRAHAKSWRGGGSFGDKRRSS